MIVTKLSRKQAGDTIVEVLISIAILSVIIVGAYVTSNHSLIAVRNAQEDAEGTALAQTQVENLTSYFQTVGHSFSTSDQCLKDNSGLITPISNGSSPCYVASNNLGAAPLISCPASAPYCYRLRIGQSSTNFTSAAHHSFTIPLTTFDVLVQWDAISGGTNQVQLYYRVDQ